MARLSIWNSGRRGLDYKYTDRIISEHFGMSGTALYVHLLEGVWDQSANGIANADTLPGGINSIEDPLFLENRSRKYSDTIYELRGIYNVSEVEGDLSQFGLFLMNDTIFIEVHLNDMIAVLGRRIIVGDVIELPHQRDDTIPGEEPAINKYYSVEDTSRAAEGYSSTWYPHIWRLKCIPMTNSQEFQDILDDKPLDPLGIEMGNSLGDLIGTIGIDMEINNAVVESAMANFVHRNFETRQFWVIDGEETNGQNPWVYAGDGHPPNGRPLSSGTVFPTPATEGEYYLRTDYDPKTLFRFLSGGWRVQEVNYREQEWNAAHRLLVDFLNNQKSNVFQNGDVEAERQALSKTVKPKADF